MLLERGRDILEKLVCPKCAVEEPVYASLGKITADRAYCPACAGVRREVVTFYKVRGDETFLERPLAQIGIPPWDIVIARAGDRAIGLEVSADAHQMLGLLSSQTEEPKWL